MTNVYGYNRKTHEEDEAILAAVKRHHDYIVNQGFIVVMTSLIGSQNYDLDYEGSDIDTISFVYPPLQHLANLEEPYNRCYVLEDGNAQVKDTRCAIQLLRKPSPNSIEYFTSKYKVYNPAFKDILSKYLDNNTKMWNMIHCDYQCMLYAMAGMAHQLTKRNMSPGERYAHAIRLADMNYHFINSKNANAVIELCTGGSRDAALAAKLDLNPNETRKMMYNYECERTADWLDDFRCHFKLTDEQKRTEEIGRVLIDSLQWELFKKYLMETNK